MITVALVAGLGFLGRPDAPGPSASSTPVAGSPGDTPGASPSLTSFGRYVVALPDDPELTQMSVGGSDMWVAGSGDGMRGVFIGTIDLEPGEVPVDAAVRLGDELSAIPGAADAGSPEPVELASGPAARVVVEVGTSRFVGYVVVVDGEGWRIVVVNYPEAVGRAVAGSFAVSPG